MLIINVGVWLVYFFASVAGYGKLFNPFALVPDDVLHRFSIWQLVTYTFLHSAGNLTHILFNMLALWMFGKDLELLWGTQRFLRFYFLCGIGAGVCVTVVNSFFGDANSRTIGASGAIFGLLVAFGMSFPEATIIYILFPIKAKYFVMIMGALAFFGTFGTNTGVSNIAHLGGLVIGFLYVRATRGARRARQSDPIDSIRMRYKQWRLERARRKFQVYMRKQGRGGPWVN